jgi:hypothetical protein
MRQLLLCTIALLFAAPAHADRFWLTDPNDAAAAAPGSSPEVIEGALLSDEGGYYRIRVVGGELSLPKSTVFRVDRDDQSVETVAAAEAASQEAGARADRERIERQRSKRSARKRKGSGARGAVVEASLTKRESPPIAFDPIIGATDPSDQQQARMREAARAFEQTRDRRYLKLLRKLRRLR